MSAIASDAALQASSTSSCRRRSNQSKPVYASLNMFPRAPNLFWIEFNDGEYVGEYSMTHPAFSAGF